MLRIFKYDLTYAQRQVVQMPKDAVILSAGTKGNGVSIWAMVDTPHVVTEGRLLSVNGTGHPLPEEIDVKGFIGTAIESGGLVWHVFELLGG